MSFLTSKMHWYIIVLGLFQAAAGIDFAGSSNSGITPGSRPSLESSKLNSLNLQSSKRKSKQVSSDDPNASIWQPLTSLASEFLKSQMNANNAVEDTDEGRKLKKRKKLLLSLLVGLKVLAAGVLLPSILALALFASWKGVTISLLAFMLAATVGVKTLLKNSKEEKHHVIVAKPASSVHEHIWRKDEDWYEKDHSPYRAYASRQIKQ